MRIIEKCMISFPPAESGCITTAAATATASHPLTLFDYPWLLFPPVQPLFFFQLPLNTHLSDFRSHILPRLKRSLSRALHSYSPLAAKLTPSLHNPNTLTFSTTSDSSVRLTFAQSDANFYHLSSYEPRDASQFHLLVPSLVTSAPSAASPLFAVQITCFTSSSSSSPGFCIGFAYHPVLCDQRCFSSFLFTWASLSKSGHLVKSLLPPTFDRSVIPDDTSLGPYFSQQLSRYNSLLPRQPNTDLVRATFVMGPADIQNARNWIIARCDERNRPHPVLLSPYIVTCALVWPSLFLSSDSKAKSGPMYFGFIAGGITRLKYEVPTSYFGNCVGFGRAVARKEELVGEEGIVAAAEALAEAIKRLDGDVMGGAETWISEWEEIKGSEEHMNVVGSPKVGLYETDFGWGRPKKVEEISVDVMRGISLTQSCLMDGGMEIGLTLTESRMETFSTLFRHGLHCFSSGAAFRCVYN